jgi:hypothetical protein
MGTGVASSPSPPKNLVGVKRMFFNADSIGAIWIVEFYVLYIMSVILWPSRTTD